MANNIDTKKMSYIAISLVVIAGIYLAYWTSSNLASEAEISNSSPKAVELRVDEYKTLTEVKNYGDKVSATEPGYGRSNPFAPVN